MRDRNVTGLFFGFFILVFTAFSLGLIAGKRLGGTQENRAVIIEENQDPWALSRDYRETKQESWTDDEELSYETPVPGSGEKRSGSLEESRRAEEKTLTPEIASEATDKEEETEAPTKKEQSVNRVAQSVLDQGEGTKSAAKKEQSPSGTGESVESRIQKIEEMKFAAEPLTRTERVYTVQIGSFKTEKDAQKITQAFKAKGYPVFTKRVDIPGKGAWHRVRIGVFETKEEARLYGDSLKSREPALQSVFVTAND